MSLNLSEEVAALFEQALEKPSSERQQFLDHVTRGKTALRTQLENLLTAANDAPDFLRSLSKDLGITSVLEGKLQHPPQQSLGPYKMLRLLGRGGMGVVYLAERNDGQFQQQVAIKMLPFGAISKEEQERFLSERQILANLQHPNIARLLDGGIDNQGTPYFVMEFIDGLSVDEYCQNNKLNIEQRLHLFIDICNAVSYAHRNLIIHRDLKPSNILIDNNNVCKLLDFGVAKLMDEHEQGHQQTTALPMTRHYAAPEMLRGENISISVDIYSLGVLLYVLLSEALPHQDLSSALAIEQAIVNTSPPKPSAIIENKKIKNKVIGDLDSIVCKAMEPKPSDRYLSVEDFKQDLQRFLSGHPIEARAVSRWYYINKFYQRHKIASTLVVAALFTIVTTATVAVWQANKAIIAQQRSQQISDFLTSVLANTHAYSTSANEASIPKLLEEAANNIDEHFEGQNQLQIEMLSLLAQSYIGLGLLQEADKILVKAVEITKSLNATPNTKTLLELHSTRVSLYRFQGRLDEMEMALDILEKLAPKANSANVKFYLRALENRVHLNINRSQNQTAVNFAKQHLTIVQEYFKTEHIQILNSRNLLAVAYSRNRDTEEAMEQSKTALMLADSLYDNRETHAVALDTRSIYADALWANGEREESISERILVAEKSKELLGFSAPLTIFSHGNVANHLVWMGKAEASLQYGLLSLPHMQTLMPQGSYNTALIHTHIGRAQLGLQNFSEAIRQLSEAKKLIVQHLDKNNKRQAIASARLALAFAVAGKFEHSKQELDKYLNPTNPTLSKIWASDPSYLYFSGTALRILGNTETAKKQLQLILDSLEDAPKNNLFRYKATIELSKLTQDPILALKLLNNADVTRFVDWDNFEVLHLLDAETALLKGRLIANGDPALATKLFRSSYEFLNKSNSNSRWTGLAAYHYGLSLQNKNKDKSVLLLNQAQRNLKNSPFLHDEVLLARLK